MSVGGIASILPSKAESMGFKVTDCGSDYWVFVVDGFLALDGQEEEEDAIRVKKVHNEMFITTWFLALLSPSIDTTFQFPDK
jgi:hypothetical protein